MKSIIIGLLIVLTAQLSHAGSATQCVSTGRGDRSQIIENVCDKTITVAFCLSYVSKNSSDDYVCGEDGRKYQQFKTLRPGQVYENRYALLFGSPIEYVACLGKESVKRRSDGGYYCR